MLSLKRYNEKTGQCWIAHVVDTTHTYPSYVEFEDKRLLVDMIQTVSWRARKAKVVGTVDDETLKQIRAVIWAIALQ